MSNENEYLDESQHSLQLLLTSASTPVPSLALAPFASLPGLWQSAQSFLCRHWPPHPPHPIDAAPRFASFISKAFRVADLIEGRARLVSGAILKTWMTATQVLGHCVFV
ncbi:hypothetical protein BT96DRAFT_156001 [Gymnopus androsaceus JB14]|uniref:Uncharacterized protein n=1 Tax=Gymnopus androsaceus JB14 TaxID=1447944 RepID=A0A6A4HDL9_9AGAR|nr:hypothetical protein BT96DRAFT_156001 [Gymnopus androsaceus JB14]